MIGIRWGAQTDAADRRVVSSTLSDPGWQSSQVITGDPLDAVRELSAAPGGEVCLTGSLELAHAVIGAGLVDEYRMFVYPHWQGRGRGFFPDGVPVPGLRLAEAKTFESGVVYLSYVPSTASRANASGPIACSACERSPERPYQAVVPWSNQRSISSCVRRRARCCASNSLT